MTSRALFWPVSAKIVSNNLAIGAEQLRGRYFVNSPQRLECGYEVFIGEDFRKQGFGDMRGVLVISLDVFGKLADSDFELF